MPSKHATGHCGCPDYRNDSCYRAEQHRAVVQDLKRLYSLLSTHRGMWEAAKGNMATLPSYAQMGLIQNDLMRCIETLE